jgi:Zn-dependent protease with chaperone function
LSAGLLRNPLGVAGALVATWFYLPFALLVAVIAAVVLGLIGFFGGTLVGPSQVPGLLTDLPVLASALDTLLSRSGGVVGGLLGVLAGLVLGFVGALLLFWELQFAEDPVAGLGSVLGVVLFGLLIGVIYTLYRLAFERALLRVGGARRMSRRERELLLPVVQECTRRLGLPNHPPVLMDDDPTPIATAHIRHLVLSRGLLATLGDDREALAGVVAHAVVHWRNADPIAAAFVRGLALPLYLIYGAASWLQRRGGHPLAHLLVWVLFWPVLVTVRYVVIPLQAVDSRRAERRADAGAALAGAREGLRRALERLGRFFEAGRNGWLRAVCATLPPHELRLEQLEDPDRRYPLAAPVAQP